MRKVPEEEAVASLRAAGMEPLEPYPGSTKPWRAQCLTCGVVGAPRLGPIRSGQQGGCRPCGYARNGSSSRVPEEQAMVEMRKAGVEPLQPYPGVNKPWACRCTACGTEGKPMLASVRRGQGACVPCGHARGGQALRVPDTQAVAEMREAGMEPLEPYPGAKVGWRARCKTCRTVGSPQLSSIRNGTGGCIPCGMAKSAAGRRLPQDEAEASLRKAGMEPLEPYPGVMKPWRARCLRCGTVGGPTLSNIRNGAGGCIPCGYQRNGQAFRLPLDEAEASLRKAGMEPLEPYPGVMKPWRARCLRCGTVGAPWLASIRAGQGGCLSCGNHNSAATRRTPEHHAIAEMRAADMEPLEPYTRSDTPWKAQCTTRGAIGAPRLVYIRAGGGGCDPCGRTLAGESNRIPAEWAIAEMREADMEPLEPYRGIRAPWRSRCLKPGCGTIGRPQLASIRAGQGGCRSCATYGFGWDSPALVYVIHHPELRAHKPGVTGTETDRLAAFIRDGWQVYSTVWMMTGAAAHTVEQTVHRQLRRLGIPGSFIRRADMRWGGYSETVSAEAISLLELEHLVHAEIARLFADPSDGSAPPSPAPGGQQAGT